MRDYLVNSQSQKGAGHSEGSWHFHGDHGSTSGGRLYCTAMATMSLEIYYRYMPIYSAESIKNGLGVPADDDFLVDVSDKN